MSFWDDISQAGVGFSRQFGGLGYEAVWTQLRPWLSNISTNGVLRWLPRAATQMSCQIPEYEGGIPRGPCRFSAIETCLGCGRPTCLNHAFVDSQGEAICYLCVVGIRQSSVEVPGPQAQHTQQPSQEAQARAHAEQRAWWARGVLNVQEGVPWESVRKQHRKISAQYHPDKPGGDEARFKDAQMAYDVLKKVYGEN